MLTNPRVFDGGYRPRRLPHRDGAITELSDALRPALHGRDADKGPSGVGKTVTVQHTLDKLTGVPTAYVRTLGMTCGGVLLSLVDQLPVNDSDVHQTTPVDERRRRLERGLDDPAVVVLNEADDLPKTEVPATLATLPVSTIAITHDATDWLARVDADAR